MMSRMLGAPFGGTMRGGHHGLESKALSLITPPKGIGGAGICFPSIVTVALGEPGVPVVCICAFAERDAAITATASIALRRMCLSGFIFCFCFSVGLILQNLSRMPKSRSEFVSL